MKSKWSVYILRDSMGALYVGITTDVERRFREHLSGGPRAAKYTRAKKQLQLVYSCPLGSRSLASKVEYRLKRLVKQQKESIVERNLAPHDLLIRLGLQETGEPE